MEMLHLKDIGTYVHDFLLPNIQKSYKHAKQYLPSNLRKSVYCIKKYLADLINDHEVVKISTNENIGSEYFTKYEALFLLMESLNMIYFFTAVVKSKVQEYDPDSECKVILRSLMKLTSSVHKEINCIID